MPGFVKPSENIVEKNFKHITLINIVVKIPNISKLNPMYKKIPCSSQVFTKMFYY